MGFMVLISLLFFSYVLAGMCFKEKGSPVKNENKDSLDRPVFKLSPKDSITIRETHESILVTGQQGSGKTTSVLYQTLQSYFSPSGMAGAGLILSVKPEDTYAYKQLFLRSGRSEEDIIIVSPKGSDQYFYDFFQDVFGDEAYTISLVGFLDKVIETINKSQSKSDFWALQTQMLFTNAIHVLKHGDEVTIENIYKFITTAPSKDGGGLEDEGEEGYEQDLQSYFCRVVNHGTNTTGKDDPAFMASRKYFLDTYFYMPSDTRGGVAASALGFLFLFTQNPLANLFGNRTKSETRKSLSLRDCYRKGKVVIIDFAILEWGDKVSITVNSIFKIAFQKLIQKAERKKYSQNLFLICDEAHHYFNSYDSVFLTTARSSRCASVFLTQNLNNFYSCVGKSREADVKSFLALIGLKMACKNSCNTTNQFFADLCGKSLQKRIGTRIPGEGEKLSMNTSQAVDYAEECRPVVYANLQGGGPPHWICETICIRSGRPFIATGTRYIRTFWKQILIAPENEEEKNATTATTKESNG